MSELHFIQNKESVIKTVDSFSYTTAIITALSFCLYMVLEVYTIALSVGIISLCFGIIIILNKTKHHNVAKFSIIGVTISSILFFSLYLGFNTGFVFYIFASPHLIYLLFNFRNKRPIYIANALYIMLFVSAYILDDYNLFDNFTIPTLVRNVIFSLNFILSLIFCFVLISIFAKNNDSYISLVEQTNQLLHEKIEQKNKTYEQLTQSLIDKDKLLAEVHHRVKNNLAFISGLLELQNFYVSDTKLSNILSDSSTRIKAIALLHEKFYEHKTLEHIEVKNFIEILIKHLNIRYKLSNKATIEYILNIDDLHLSMNVALPFALLINELIINSLKHAFINQEKPTIHLSIKIKNNLVEFNYTDNGIGFDIEKETKEKSLGINLIDAFTKQLKAQKTFNSILGKGVEINLTFKQN